MVDVKLINYIKEGLDKGYTKAELERILKENGWSNIEISEGIATINKTEKISNPLRKKQDPDSILIRFINQSLEKRIPEEQIRQALIAKHWPIDKINSAFSKSIRPKPVKEIAEPKPRPIVEKPQPQKKVKKEYVGRGFDGKRLFLYILWFVVIGIILTATIGVFYYVKAMSTFSIIDPNTGDEVKGYCLEADCSDMKEHTKNELVNNWVIILTIALSI